MHAVAGECTIEHATHPLIVLELTGLVLAIIVRPTCTITPLSMQLTLGLDLKAYTGSAVGNADTQCMNTKENTIHAEHVRRSWTIIIMAMPQAMAPDAGSNIT